MRASCLVVAASTLLASVVVSGVPAFASPNALARDNFDTGLFQRDGDHGHHHNPHAQPLLQLNETEVLMYHQATPPSWYTFDWEGEGNPSAARHPGLMIGHIVFMSLAFFGALPVGIILRSVRHPAHGAAMISFYGLCALGVSSSALYKKLSPNMYEGSVHGKQSFFVLFLAICLSAIDILAGFRRFAQFLRSDKKTIKQFWTFVILNQDPEQKLNGPEYSGLIVDDPENYEFTKLSPVNTDDSPDDSEEWTNPNPRHQRSTSTASDRTMFHSHSDETLHEVSNGKRNRWLGFLQIVFAVLERSLVLSGLGMTLTGIVVYTGGCRQNWVNGCLAHLIKGAIFWCYGLMTFARFLGAYADLGWAWNRAPSGSKYTAEFVESAVIFTYGITNTWMERFGAHPGDPFTTKQIQHIGIAVMFWFAGLVGMGIESRTIRRWLASSTFASSTHPGDLPRDAVTEPPSYIGSFNPFPALVIGVTGAAMAAHAQTYLFQVQIHELWGNFLVAFSVIRCLTYFFLWLNPPKSILPSRPPTEALGSFFLACGGLVFMFSTEEVTIAAMRRGRDDVMMFLNVAVAMTCLAFCWTLCVVGFKGYLKSRKHPNLSFRSSTA